MNTHIAELPAWEALLQESVQHETPWHTMTIYKAGGIRFTGDELGYYIDVRPRSSADDGAEEAFNVQFCDGCPAFWQTQTIIYLAQKGLLRVE